MWNRHSIGKATRLIILYTDIGTNLSNLRNARRFKGGLPSVRSRRAAQGDQGAARGTATRFFPFQDICRARDRFRENQRAFGSLPPPRASREARIVPSTWEHNRQAREARPIFARRSLKSAARVKKLGNAPPGGRGRRRLLAAFAALFSAPKGDFRQSLPRVRSHGSRARVHDLPQNGISSRALADPLAARRVTDRLRALAAFKHEGGDPSQGRRLNQGVRRKSWLGVAPRRAPVRRFSRGLPRPRRPKTRSPGAFSRARERRALAGELPLGKSRPREGGAMWRA
jgi:hypothetical protein